MLLSTTAIPGVFPYVDWKDTKFVDGGMMKNFDAVGGI